MSESRWVVFDAGGVLLNWHKSSAGLAGYLNVPKDELMETVFQAAPAMNIGKTSAVDGWSVILEKLDKKSEDPLSIIRRWRHPDYWIKDTLKLVRELNDADYRLAMLSNSWLGLTVPEELETLPLEIKLFEHILDSSQEKIKKPDPAFYQLAEQRLGASKNQIFFIDDDATNLPPAISLGWRTYHYITESDGIASNNELRNILLP